MPVVLENTKVREKFIIELLEANLDKGSLEGKRSAWILGVRQSEPTLEEQSIFIKTRKLFLE